MGSVGERGPNLLCPLQCPSPLGYALFPGQILRRSLHPTLDQLLATPSPTSLCEIEFSRPFLRVCDDLKSFAANNDQCSVSW